MTKDDYNPQILVKLREEKGLTQEEVANKIGKSRYTIIRAESGESASWKLLQTLTNFYGSQMSDVIHSAQTV